jgi:hypothetical protein
MFLLLLYTLRVFNISTVTYSLQQMQHSNGFGEMLSTPSTTCTEKCTVCTAQSKAVVQT